MHYLPGIFSLLVLAAGWYYLFYSPAAKRLAAIENPRLNALRVRLRRLNGIVMMLLAVAFYGASYAVTKETTAAWVSLSVVVLMGVMVLLALVDMQLTRKLREQRKREEPK